MTNWSMTYCVHSFRHGQICHCDTFPSNGTDNAIYRLGDELGLRLPRIHWAVHQVGKEYDLLDWLSPKLPVSVPLPIAKGEPGSGYPYQWLVYEWLPGEDLEHAHIDDFDQLARDIADFVACLGRIESADAPSVGPRGGPLAPHDRATQAAIRRLEGTINAEHALAVWRRAVEADRWQGPPIWVHADLLPGNILVRNGRLYGVIDWGGAGLGDPACEAMVAWFLPPSARHIYREALGFDDATWDRARGWVVQQTVLFIPYYAKTIPDGVAAAELRLQAALDDFEGTTA